MANPIDSISSAAGSTGSSSFTQARQDALNAVANELGISQSDLRSALSSGQTIEQLAAAKGISSSDVQSTVEAALKADLPNASDAQISGIASRIVTGHHHGHHARAGSSGGAASASGGAIDASGEGNASSESQFSITV